MPGFHPNVIVCVTCMRELRLDGNRAKRKRLRWQLAACQRKRLRLDGNRAWEMDIALCVHIPLNCCGCCSMYDRTNASAFVSCVWMETGLERWTSHCVSTYRWTAADAAPCTTERTRQHSWWEIDAWRCGRRRRCWSPEVRRTAASPAYCPAWRRASSPETCRQSLRSS